MRFPMLRGISLGFLTGFFHARVPNIFRKSAEISHEDSMLSLFKEEQRQIEREDSGWSRVDPSAKYTIWDCAGELVVRVTIPCAMGEKETGLQDLIYDLYPIKHMASLAEIQRGLPSASEYFFR